MKLVILVLTIFLSASAFVYPQGMKKYTGIFTLTTPWNQEGKATYSYTEENGKQVFQGKFTLLYSGKEDKKGISQNVSGNYKNGLREGKWIFVASYADWKLSDDNSYKTGTCTLTVNYKSGKPDGALSYISSYKIRQKTEKQGKANYTAFSKINKESIKVNFNQGIIGSFIYEIPNPDPKDVYKISFLCDEDGYLQKINLNKENLKSEEILYHGLVNPSPEEKSKLDKYLMYLKNHKDSLAYLPFNYVSKKFSGNDFLKSTSNAENYEFLFEKIYDDIFLWNDIPGDLTYDKSLSNSGSIKNTTLIGFQIRVQTAQAPREKTLPDELAAQFKKINSTISSLLTSLKDDKINKCASIPEADVAFKTSKNYLDTLINIQQTITELEKFYKGVSSGNTYNSIIDNSLVLKNSSEKDLLDNVISKLLFYDTAIIPLLKSLDGFFTKFEFETTMKEGNSLIEQKNYAAAIKAFERAAFLNPADKNPKIKIDEAKGLTAIAEAEAKRMQVFNYLVDNFRKIPANYKYGEERKNLYNAYLVLKEYYLKSIDNPANDAFKKLEICNDAVKLVEKMNELQNKNTEDLEKQLKKIKEPEEIRKILGL